MPDNNQIQETWARRIRREIEDAIEILKRKPVYWFVILVLAVFASIKLGLWSGSGEKHIDKAIITVPAEKGSHDQTFFISTGSLAFPTIQLNTNTPPAILNYKAKACECREEKGVVIRLVFDQNLAENKTYQLFLNQSDMIYPIKSTRKISPDDYPECPCLNLSL